MTDKTMLRRAFLRRAATGATALVGLACTVAADDLAVSAGASPSPRTPFVDFRRHATPYAGPGREREDPADVAEVVLGYFGPTDPADREGGDVRRAVEMAIDEANRGGGYRGKPFRFVSVWSDNPWKAGVGLLARMVYRDRVWALVGGIDGPSAHLAEQVVAKARLPLVCPTGSDRTANVANVSWMFSALPGDHLQAPVVAQAIAAHTDGKGFAVVASEDHDARLFLAEIQRVFAAKKMGPRFQYGVQVGEEDVAGVARRVASEQVGGVLVLAGADDSARLVVSLRAAGFSGAIFGSHRFGRRRFAELAGPAAQRVYFPRLFESSDRSKAFENAFQQRFRIRPDYSAAFGYDSVTLLVAAIRVSGLNRAKIGDAIRAIAPWNGVSGVIAWDTLGSNTAPVHLGTFRNGVAVRAEAS